MLYTLLENNYTTNYIQGFCSYNLRREPMKISPIMTNFQAGVSSQSIIARALFELKKIEFDNNDLIYMRCLGAKDVFENGKEAADFIKSQGIKVEFEKFEDPQIHARWDYDKNTIFINSSYSKLNDLAGVLAISEAILHEAGHAKDLDPGSSLQEELECLALNVLAHRYHKKIYPGIFENQSANLFDEGVKLYENLFFQFDLNKTQLKERMNKMYGFLSAECPKHPSSKFVQEITKLNITG